MEEEHSPVIDIVGDVTKAPLPEALSGSSSSDASLGETASDVAEDDVEDVVDPHELARSYDFRASLVTVSRIRQLESLGYFVEGSMHEPGEETVTEPKTDEVIIFEEFFCRGIADAASSCFHRDFAQILGAAASADPERYCLDVRVFLGSAELQRGT
jgi:hypothetical protein